MKIPHAICLVTGKLGCGKSYIGTWQATYYAAQGKPVYLNYDLYPGWWDNADKLHNAKNLFQRWGILPATDKTNPLEWRNNVYRFHEQDDVFDLIAPGDPEQEDRALLVSDEMALRAAARDSLGRRRRQSQRYGEENADKDTEFYVNMRKSGFTCMILTQHRDMIDANLRRVAGCELQLQNTRRTLIPLVGIPLTKKDFFVYTMWDLANDKRTGFGFMRGSPLVYNSYRSMQRFSQIDRGGSGVRLQTPPEPMSRPVESYEDWERRTRAVRRLRRARGGSPLPGLSAADPGVSEEENGRTVLVTPSEPIMGDSNAG